MSIEMNKNSLKFYKNKVDEMIRKSEAEEILPFLKENLSIIKLDNDLMTVWYLAMMTQKELEAGVKSIFEKESSLPELLNRYVQLKFYLRRIENEILEEKKEFLLFLLERNVSEFELMGVINSSIYYKEKVWSYLKESV